MRKVRVKKELVGERTVEDILKSPKLKTTNDYVKYIDRLKDEAESLKIKLLDISCDYEAVVRKIQLMESERYEKANKKATSKVKKDVKEARSRS